MLCFWCSSRYLLGILATRLTSWGVLWSPACFLIDVRERNVAFVQDVFLLWWVGEGLTSVLACGRQRTGFCTSGEVKQSQGKHQNSKYRGFSQYDSIRDASVSTLLVHWQCWVVLDGQPGVSHWLPCRQCFQEWRRAANKEVLSELLRCQMRWFQNIKYPSGKHSIVLRIFIAQVL